MQDGGGRENKDDEKYRESKTSSGWNKQVVGFALNLSICKTKVGAIRYSMGTSTEIFP